MAEYEDYGTRSTPVGLLDRGGGGGGGFLVGCIGVIGVCKENACVYNSSSDDDGDEEKSDSVEESKGFVARRLSEIAIENTPFGWSVRYMVSHVLAEISVRANLDYPTTPSLLNLGVELNTAMRGTVGKMNHTHAP